MCVLNTSSPFDQLPAATVGGRGFNPLLPNPGQAFHPQMLYMGYVGFAVAFAIAAPLDGRLDATWLC